MFALLAIISAILEGVHYSHEQEVGFYINYQGELNITNWSKFVQNWDPNVLIGFKGHTFKLVNGKLIGIDCDDCELKQDASGELYIEYKARLEPKKLRKRDEEGKPSVGIQSSALGRSG